MRRPIGECPWANRAHDLMHRNPNSRSAGTEDVCLSELTVALSLPRARILFDGAFLPQAQSALPQTRRTESDCVRVPVR
jgi:hypothetical protein